MHKIITISITIATLVASLPVVLILMASPNRDLVRENREQIDYINKYCIKKR